LKLEESLLPIASHEFAIVVAIVVVIFIANTAIPVKTVPTLRLPAPYLLGPPSFLRGGQ